MVTSRSSRVPAVKFLQKLNESKLYLLIINYLWICLKNMGKGLEIPGMAKKVEISCEAGRKTAKFLFNFR